MADSADPARSADPSPPRRPPRMQAVPRSVRVGLLGLGTVGAGVLEVLERNRADIEQKVGRGIEVARILVRDPARVRSVAVPAALLTTDVASVVGDPDIDIVVEVMGGTTDALAAVLAALRAGKHVVTANKDIMAEHGAAVWEAAAEGGVDVFFEASVGGGIPIVRAVKESLAANRVRRIAGILNGTTNYILTRMTQEGCSLDEALAAAQALGYAEADPTADIEGVDAARKLCILSSIAYSSRCRVEDVYRQGIGDISAVDIAHAAQMGWTIKLLAISDLRDGRISMRVHPTFVPHDHPLAAVNDTFNAIYIQGDAVGEAMFYGRGAGGLPTASAVLGDLMEAARFFGREGRVTGCTCFHQRPVDGPDGICSRFYVRLLVADRVGVLEQIAGVFGRAGVSILSVQQTPVAEPASAHPAARAELIVVTHGVREDHLQAAISGLRHLDAVAGVGAVLRLAPEDL